ncbi:hypothetical protein Ctob_002474 [Chrysochromulina tobinii]|uniref:Uncharacterized protein n=1 Tax=Chrysochromulina tobinii TaxID=1460289 RepID=A0A0M0J791_9EUKA|nr:hypothetical protein Ctob_002474 [Chrysochromulina tobinii]|eukprot:KOO22441.1 hypothetical protein Ctob_002474 [Chrysochromulina sp. CCMP291]
MGFAKEHEEIDRGWYPERGIPPAAGSPNRQTPMPSQGPPTPSHMRGTSSSARMSSPRGSSPAKRGPATRKNVAEEQRGDRRRSHDYKTETEKAFQDPSNHDPIEDEYGRPIRRLYSGRIKKRVDLKHEGESDEVIYQYTGEGSANPNKYALDEIYPEKFDDAAGQPSKTLFAKNARMRMVEYFPEKDIKAYLGGEADELMFGHSVAGAGVGQDQYEVREVPDLMPNSFMGSAGLTSKELQRHVLKEKINQDGPETFPHVADAADEIIYGRRTNRHYNRVDKITDLPLHGKAGFRDAAGMLSRERARTGQEPLEKKLDNIIKHETRPYLGGEADEVIYGRQMGGNRSELNEIKDLRPKMFAGAAGLTSNEVIKANPDLEHYIIEQPPGSSSKLELRRGGEMAERLGACDGEAGEPLRIASSYPEVFSGLATGGEAAQAIYGNTGNTDLKSFIHQGAFEISSVYPRAYRGVAGASSRNLFKNSPEAGGRHLFSENLKGRVIGQKGCGTDAKPKGNPGGAGLNSKELFKGHKLQAIGDTPRDRNNDVDGDGISDHLRDEEADIVLYGGDLDDSELRKVGGIPDKNPKAFEGAAGLTSRQVFRAQQECLVGAEYHPEEHKLGQARWGGEMESVMYGEHSSNRSVIYEVQKLAPEKYEDAAGLTSKHAQAVREDLSMDDARGKKTMPAPERARGNPNAHGRVDITNFDKKAFHEAAGLSSIQQHRGEDEEAMLTCAGTGGVRDARQFQGEAASVVFGGPPPPEQTAHKSIAGLTSSAVHHIKKSGYEARRLDVRTMRDPGGSEAHDVMYAKRAEDVEYDGNEEPRIDELPEKYPENFTGAAGLSTKDTFRQLVRPYMFGEKTSDGMEMGAKHITSLNAAATPSQLNTAFMRASHWFEPDDTPGAGRARKFTPEEVEQSMAAAELAEESRRHKLYQSYASYGAASGYQDAEHTGTYDQYEWQQEEAPKWARERPGSFAARKLEATRDAYGYDNGPLSGRSSQPSPGRASLGQYADFASRLNAAESQRSQRSARSYRG